MKSESHPRNVISYRPTRHNRGQLPDVSEGIGWPKNRVIDWCVTRGLIQLQKRLKTQTAAK
jgi:hypothetical protein